MLIIRIVACITVAAVLFLGGSQTFGQVISSTTDDDSVGQALVGSSIPGTETSTLRYHNISYSNTSVAHIEYNQPDGSSPDGIADIIQLMPSSQQQSSRTIDLYEGSKSQASPFYGSAVAVSTRPLSTLHIKTITTSENTAIGMLSGVSQGFTRQYLPVLVKNFKPVGVTESMDSRFTIMNTSTTQSACVWVAYHNTQNERVYDDGLYTTSSTCPTRGIEISPLGQINRDLSTETVLGDTFAGSAIIVVEANSNGMRAPITATIDVWNDSQLGSMEGAGLVSSTNKTDGVHKKLLFPMVTKNWGYNGWNSHVIIQNASFTDDIWVRLIFRGSSLPDGKSQTRVLVERNRWVDLSQIPDNILPDNFVGSLTVRTLAANKQNPGHALATGAVISTYSGELYKPLLAYRAIPADATTNKVILPLFYNMLNTGWSARLAIMPVNGKSDELHTTMIRDYCCPRSAESEIALQSSGKPFYSMKSWLDYRFQGSGELCSLNGKRFAVLVIIEKSVSIDGEHTTTGDTWAAYPGTPRRTSVCPNLKGQSP